MPENWGSLYLGKATAAARAALPIPAACAMFSCVQTMVWLPQRRRGREGERERRTDGQAGILAETQSDRQRQRHTERHRETYRLTDR